MASEFLSLFDIFVKLRGNFKNILTPIVIKAIVTAISVLRGRVNPEFDVNRFVERIAVIVAGNVLHRIIENFAQRACKSLIITGYSEHNRRNDKPRNGGYYRRGFGHENVIFLLGSGICNQVGHRKSGNINDRSIRTAAFVCCV